MPHAFGTLKTQSTVICDQLWPLATVCDHFQTSATICDHLWAFAAVCDRLRLFATVRDPMRPIATVCDILQPSRQLATIYDHWRPIATVSDHLRSLTVRDSLRPRATISDHLLHLRPFATYCHHIWDFCYIGEIRDFALCNSNQGGYIDITSLFQLNLLSFSSLSPPLSYHASHHSQEVLRTQFVNQSIDKTSKAPISSADRAQRRTHP